MAVSYIIWNGSPEIFTNWSISLRWYGLLFALGFLFSQQILYYIFKREGKPVSDVDNLLVYMVIATIIGARLGHIIFYQSDMFIKDPWAVFFPFDFNFGATFPFITNLRLTGYQGSSSQGAAFGILFALWLYGRKKRSAQNFLQILDRIVIVIALTGALIRFGNFFNAKNIGKPYIGPLSVVFFNPVINNLIKDGNTSIVQSLNVKKDRTLPNGDNGRVPVDLYIFFKPGVKEMDARLFMYNNVRANIQKAFEFADDHGGGPLRFKMVKDTDDNYAAKVEIYAISRHPVQLYECLSCILLSLLLFWIWTLRKERTPEGRIFGLFMIILWTLQFFYAFLKENRAPFENGFTSSIGQIFNSLFVLVGVFVLIRSYRIEHQLDDKTTRSKNFVS